MTTILRLLLLAAVSSSLASAAAAQAPPHAWDEPLQLSPDTPDAPEKDGLRLLREAIALRDHGNDPPSASVMEVAGYPPFPREWHDRSAWSEQAHQRLLAKVRAARTSASADWGTIASDADANRLLDTLNSLRDLANVVGDAALYAELQGDHAEAVERIYDLRHIAALTDECPLQICHLTAIGIESLAMLRLMTIAPALAFEPGQGVQQPATRQQLRPLIEQILDEQPRKAREQRMRDFERTTRAGQRLAQATEQASLGDWDRLLVTHKRIEAARRMTALSLAIQLYRAEHAGSVPATLEQLVPQFVETVPGDPMSPENLPLGYRIVRGSLPDGGDRPLLFHRGDNYGPNPRPDRVPPTPSYGWDVGSKVQCRDVLRWSPQAP